MISLLKSERGEDEKRDNDRRDVNTELMNRFRDDLQLDREARRKEIGRSSQREWQKMERRWEDDEIQEEDSNVSTSASEGSNPGEYEESDE